MDEELRRYDDHMDHVRGLAPKSRTMVLRIVGRLLAERFDDNAVDIKAITPEHVRRFFAEQATLHSKPAGAGSVVSSLRGYFRYRASLGDLVHGLIGALAYPANWALSSLPKKLTDEEVAQLSLDVIDWHAGTVTLRHTKGRRVDILPLPVATGEAIARYLELERPKTSNRAIFVRNVAPRDAPPGADLIRSTIRQAYARAGLPSTRSHLLRHTMANRLLASGSSLKEVADVLRHRSLNTTMIYANVGQPQSCCGGAAVTWECVMSAAAMPFKSRVERFLVERHGLGFSARGEACTLRSFARHLHKIGHCGPLTIEVMTDWARRDSHGSTDPVTWARRLKRLRTFVRWLQQFEPDTEVPDDTVFGRVPKRKAPHIYSEQEIIDLLASARRLGPASGLRGVIFVTLFGLIASTGLRIGKA